MDLPRACFLAKHWQNLDSTQNIVIRQSAMSTNIDAPTTTVTNNKENEVAKKPRGAGFTHTVACKSFIAASEDPFVGTSQKGRDFKKKMHKKTPLTYKCALCSGACHADCFTVNAELDVMCDLCAKEEN